MTTCNFTLARFRTVCKPFFARSRTFLLGFGLFQGFNGTAEQFPFGPPAPRGERNCQQEGPQARGAGGKNPRVTTQERGTARRDEPHHRRGTPPPRGWSAAQRQRGGTHREDQAPTEGTADEPRRGGRQAREGRTGSRTAQRRGRPADEAARRRGGTPCPRKGAAQPPGRIPLMPQGGRVARTRQPGGGVPPDQSAEPGPDRAGPRPTRRERGPPTPGPRPPGPTCDEQDEEKPLLRGNGAQGKPPAHLPHVRAQREREPGPRRTPTTCGRGTGREARRRAERPQEPRGDGGTGGGGGRCHP